MIKRYNSYSYLFKILIG